VWTLNAAGDRVVWLESPPPDAPGGANVKAPADAKNGPICSVNRIMEMDGPKTWLVNVQFTTWVNNCNENTSPILSHRWEQGIDTDQDGFAIITRRGTVVFNAGRLYGADQSPDFYHGQFFQAPPPNFAREKVNVTVASDNSKAEYTVVDRERVFNLGWDSPATRVEATLTTYWVQGSLMNVAADMAAGAPMTGGEIAGMWGGVATFGMSSAWAAQSYVRRQVGSAAASTVQQLPKYRATFDGQAWGGRTSTRKRLYQLLLGIAMRRIGPPDFFNRAGTTSVIVSQDCMTKHVRIQMTFEWSDRTIVQLFGAFGQAGALGATFGVAYQIGANPNDPIDWLAEQEEDMLNLKPSTAPNAVGDPTLNVTQRPIGNRQLNPSSIESRNSRGPGFYQYMITQALLGQCETPPMPGAPLTNTPTPPYPPPAASPFPPRPNVVPINNPPLPVDGRL
jgi:hypothetical protein